MISHVLPFPGKIGQQQRVAYMLQAVRHFFHVTFLTVAEKSVPETDLKLSALCDETIVLPSRFSNGKLSRTFHRAAGQLYALTTGLKSSNYAIGKVDLSPARVSEAIEGQNFDAVLYEYWHAMDSLPLFQSRSIPCVLDMHNVLWQSHAQRLRERQLPEWWRKRALQQYKEQEEKAWNRFDGIVAINHAEYNYVRERINASNSVFYTPMGVDLRNWPYSWQKASPQRVGYYGGLGTPHNQEAALRCYREIMPEIWKQFPNTELWLVGSNPPKHLQELASDSRVKVTGFVKDVGSVLRHMTAVLCPWAGTYGFRSRLVEVMSLGVPVVATPDAVDGMDLENGKGLLLGNTSSQLAESALRLLQDEAHANEQSRMAREQMEGLYDLPNTYGRFAREFFDWYLERRKKVAA